MSHRYRPLVVQNLPITAPGSCSFEFPAFSVEACDSYVLLNICLLLSDAQTRGYRYSKLYYCVRPEQNFDEDRVICFEVPERNRLERILISLPGAVWDEARARRYLRLRVDPLPDCAGDARIEALRLVHDRMPRDQILRAWRIAHRQAVRAEVLASERSGRSWLPHYPESLSIELTPRCNLRCPHCSAHGTHALHRHHNLRDEMPPDLLGRLADEAFPHASVISLVGRGEPTLASDPLWDVLTEQLIRHDVRISCVTNGTRVIERFGASLIPWVHELCFSIDGARDETIRTNRAGTDRTTLLRNLENYHRLRTTLPLARRPQLSFSWTIKRNNIAELVDFIYMVAPFEPDLLSIRHMVAFRDDVFPETLFNAPEVANEHLREAYEVLDRLGIRHESPPLIQSSDSAPLEPGDPAPAPAVREAACNWMHRTAIIMSDGEVTTCGKHYGIGVGNLHEAGSLDAIWNGPAMCSLRAAFAAGTPWDQCRACWLREIRWHAQRQAKDRNEAYAHQTPMDYTQQAWDYRTYAAL